MRIGIDLGGTKIEGLVLDKGGVERERLRVPTPASSYEEDVAAIVELIAELERRAGARCTVGIAHPGAISPATGLVKNANSTRLNGRPLKTDLERRLGREVRLANDANCFAVSEASDGAGRRLQHRVRRHPGHRRRRRRGDRRPAAHRRAGDRRRMGPQSAAAARATTNGPARAATAAAPAASKPG